MASNIVEILIGAKDDAKLDLDSLKAKLTELAHTVAEARAGVKGDKEAAARLDQLGAKLIRFGHRTENAKIGLEGQFKLMAELGAVELALDRVRNKADGAGSGGGMLGSLRNAAMGGSRALESLGSAGTTFINPITIALAGLAAIISGPVLASLLPITLGFGVFGAVAVHEISKVIAAHQKLQAAQQAYEKATTKAGRQSALKAEQMATEDLSGSEKGLLGMLSQLGQQFSKLEKSVQPEIMYSMFKALDIVKQLMPTLKVLVRAAAVAFADFMNNITNWIASPSGKKFLHWMQTDGPNAIKRFGQVMWDVTQGIGRTFAFLRNAGDTWWKNFHATVSHVEHAWNATASAFRFAAHEMAPVFGFLRNAGNTWWQNFHATVSHVMNAWNDTVHAFQTAYHAIASVFDGIKSTVGGAVDWIVGKIHTLTGALGSINGALGGIPGKVLGALGLASGGIVGAASGGIRSNLTMVGEHGPELVQLSAGSRVYNNSQTQGMLAGAQGGGGRVVLELRSGGSGMDDAIIEIIRKAVSNRGGGDVQAYLGGR